MSSITYQVTVTQQCTKYELNGKLHREDGPAYVGAGIGQHQEWYLDGHEYYTEADFKKEMAKRNKRNNSCNGKVVEIDGVQYTLSKV